MGGLKISPLTPLPFHVLNIAYRGYGVKGYYYKYVDNYLAQKIALCRIPITAMTMYPFRHIVSKDITGKYSFNCFD